MTEPPAPPGPRALVIAFLALELLAVLSWIVSSLGAVTVIVLAIAVVQAVVSLTVFMELRSAHPVLRVTAAIVVFFIALLCAGMAGDAALR